MPELTVRLLQNMDPRGLQRMLDLTPKFKAYLKSLIDEGSTDIRTIVQQKNIDLSRESDHSKQLAHRLVEKVIPRMIMKLEQPLNKGSGIRGRMLAFADDYVAGETGSVWETAIRHWEENNDKGLKNSRTEIKNVLKAALEVTPEIHRSDGKLEAVFNLKNDRGSLKFRYHPDYIFDAGLQSAGHAVSNISDKAQPGGGGV